MAHLERPPPLRIGAGIKIFQKGATEVYVQISIWASWTAFGVLKCIVHNDTLNQPLYKQPVHQS